MSNRSERRQQSRRKYSNVEFASYRIKKRVYKIAEPVGWITIGLIVCLVGLAIFKVATNNKESFEYMEVTLNLDMEPRAQESKPHWPVRPSDVFYRAPKSHGLYLIPFDLNLEELSALDSIENHSAFLFMGKSGEEDKYSISASSEAYHISEFPDGAEEIYRAKNGVAINEASNLDRRVKEQVSNIQELTGLVGLTLRIQDATYQLYKAGVFQGSLGYYYSVSDNVLNILDLEDKEEQSVMYISRVENNPFEVTEEILIESQYEGLRTTEKENKADSFSYRAYEKDGYLFKINENLSDEDCDKLARYISNPEESLLEPTN